ncbi:hypothetical protein ABW19_dt0204570 [Dactylella cylindrospora]|nr:hypothetical protein ABW19_dt0204570 [Dactylella cylindrospora]
MILHFLCFGKLPYLNSDEEHEENEEIDKLRDEISAWAGYNDKYRSARSDIPDKLFRNLGRLLSADPTKRPSAADILAGIRSEFGYGEDGIPRRTPVSPKTTNLGLADDGRFHRISPVPSSPATPILNPTTSLSRPMKPRNGSLSGSQHTRRASKLREITSELNLPESLSAVEPSESSFPAASVVSPPSDSSSSSDEGPLIPVRTLSSSLILRPKGQKSASPQGSDGIPDPGDDTSRSMVMPVVSKPPALTGPPSPVNPKVVTWLTIMPHVWLALKILIFFGKVCCITV